MNIKKEGGIVGFTDETVRFNLDDSNRKEISDTLKDVYLSLDEKGYNPINQIVGYVLVITTLATKFVSTNEMKLLKNWFVTT